MPHPKVALLTNDGRPTQVRRRHDASEEEHPETLEDDLSARLDTWEIRNPEAAKLAPWYQAREAWRQAGKPRPHWIEALKWREAQVDFAPVRSGEINKDLLMRHVPAYRARREA